MVARGQRAAELGYDEDEPVCIITVGGSGVGHDLLEMAIAAHPIARRSVPGLRTIAAAGPRIDTDSLPRHPVVEVRGYVDRLDRNPCVCDLAIVQGGLTTTMELTAAKRPFIYFPLSITSSRTSTCATASTSTAPGPGWISRRPTPTASPRRSSTRSEERPTSATWRPTAHAARPR